MNPSNLPLPTVLLPGLFCTPRVFAPQIPALWALGPVTVANHAFDDTMAALAKRVLADAPPAFALAGISMGGYLAFEILRQAPQRVRKLVLLSTSARPDTPEQTQRRESQIRIAESGRLTAIADLAFPTLVHPKHHDDAALKQVFQTMIQETGAEAFVRQQRAIMSRVDSRPSLAHITCPTLVIGAQDDALIPHEMSEEMARGIPGARLQTLAECGHMSTLEQPARVNAALVDFFRQ